MSQSTQGPPQVGLHEETDTETRGWVPLALSVSTEFDQTLRELAARHNGTFEDELMQAVAVYRFLSDQAQEGKRVGVAREGQELETEIRGL